MSLLKISLLGPFSAVRAGSPGLVFPARSAQALLAYLAEESRADRPHLRDVLAELLWPGMAPGSARRNLRQSLYELNRSVHLEGQPSILVANREEIGLDGRANVQVDSHIFEDALRTPSIDRLQNAIELYRGAFLDGFTLPDSPDFEAWVGNRRAHYQRRFREALHTLIRLDPEGAGAYSARLLETDPLDESAARKRMAAQVRQGDRTGALKTYAGLKEALRDDLGVEPDSETTSLYERIAAGDADLAAPPVAPAPTAPPVRLPGSATPFIGRGAEIAALAELLGDPAQRLVTLIGPGGTGKTRLAVQVAANAAGEFPDGVFFVPLSGAADEAAFVSALAQSLDIAFHTDDRPMQRILDTLAEKEILLVLDNYEALSGVPGLADRILSGAPRVKLLATTRVRLNVLGEQLFPVGGLPVPEPGWERPGHQIDEVLDRYSALRLFVDRSHRVRPGYAIGVDDLPPVVEICRLVQGMPLAIELAAAWTPLLRPGEIAAEIRRSLDFLEADWVNLPDRQRSIRAVCDSSWALLAEPEREAFRRLSVFPGGFSREAAQEVSGASLKTLMDLANKSWLHVTDTGRFRLHGLLRQYGLEQLGPGSEGWRRANTDHARCYAEFVAEQTRRLSGPDQPAALDAIEREFPNNIQAALTWLAADRDWATILDGMMMGLYVFVTIRGKMEDLIAWLQRVRKQFAGGLEPGDELAHAVLGIVGIVCEDTMGIQDFAPLDRVRSLWQFVLDRDLAGRMGYWFVMLAEYCVAKNVDPQARTLLDRAVAGLDTPENRWVYGHALLLQSNVWTEFSIRPEKLTEAGAIFEKLGTPYEQGLTALIRAQAEGVTRPSPDEVLALYERVKQNFSAVRERYHLFRLSHKIAEHCFKWGLYAEGFGHLQDGHRLVRSLGSRRLLAYNLHVESEFALRYSTFEHALAANLESTALAERFETQSDVYWRYQERGEIYRVHGDRENAAACFERARAGFEALSITLGLGYIRRAQGDFALEDGRYEEALEYYRLYLESGEAENHLWTLAHAHGKLGIALAHMGSLAESRRATREAIIRCHGWHNAHLGPEILVGEIVCLVMSEAWAEAAALAELVRSTPSAWVETRQQVGRLLDEVGGRIPEGEFSAARERGRRTELNAVLRRLEDG